MLIIQNILKLFHMIAQDITDAGGLSLTLGKTWHVVKGGRPILIHCSKLVLIYQLNSRIITNYACVHFVNKLPYDTTWNTVQGTKQ